MSKKIIIVTIIGLLCAGIGLILLLKNVQNNPGVSPTPTGVRLTATPIATIIPTDLPLIPTDSQTSEANTGIDMSPFSEPTLVVVQSSYDLRTKLPIKIEQFEITYDYQMFKFKVAIADPYSDNLAYFRNWITANKYDAIPTEDFVIIRGK